jgi:hypothetical protein
MIIADIASKLTHKNHLEGTSSHTLHFLHLFYFLLIHSTDKQQYEMRNERYTCPAHGGHWRRKVLALLNS